MNGSGNYSPGGGGSPSRGGLNFGGNPGQHNSLEYMRAVSSSLYISLCHSADLIGVGGGGWAVGRAGAVHKLCSHFVYPSYYLI